MKNIFLFIFLFVFILVSCKKNTTEPEDGKSFSLQLQVNDSNGNPLPNINISIWSKFPFSDGLRKTLSTRKVEAATSIKYALIKECFVDLACYELDGEIKKTLVSTRQAAGYYSVFLNINSEDINRAYKIKLVTSSDSLKKNVFFQDSIYAVLIQPDPVLTVVGKTDLNGKLKITNKLLFPHLYNLPPLTRTSAYDPSPIGSFTYSDSVAITLSNESFSNSVSYSKPIIDGENNYQLAWTIKNSKASNAESEDRILELVDISKNLYGVPTKWELSQNYPNPFN